MKILTVRNPPVTSGNKINYVDPREITQQRAAKEKGVVRRTPAKTVLEQFWKDPSAPTLLDAAIVSSEVGLVSSDSQLFCPSWQLFCPSWHMLYPPCTELSPILKQHDMQIKQVLYYLLTVSWCGLFHDLIWLLFCSSWQLLCLSWHMHVSFEFGTFSACVVAAMLLAVKAANNNITL